jgi:hypothetical protein
MYFVEYNTLDIYIGNYTKRRCKATTSTNEAELTLLAANKQAVNFAGKCKGIENPLYVLE